MAETHQDDYVLGLEYLRGVAALLVVYGHVVVVGTLDPTSPHSYFPFIHATAITIGNLNPYLWPEWQVESLKVNTGHLAVSVFFLISGFVIIPAVEKHGSRRFLIGRFFRIIPLSVAVALTAGLVFSFGFGSSQFPISRTISTGLLLTEVTRQAPTNPVIWSLIVEAWFYVLVAWLLSAFAKLNCGVLLGTGLVCAVVVVIAACCLSGLGLPSVVIAWGRMVAYNCLFIIHIIVGSALYLAWRDKRNRGRSIIVALLLGGLFCAAVWVDRKWNAAPAGFNAHNLFWGAVVFVTALLLNQRIPRSKIAAFFARISYPLYLVHLPLAWLLLFEFERLGLAAPLNFLATFAICIFVAWLFHFFVEAPSHRLGRHLARRMTSMPIFDPPPIIDGRGVVLYHD